MSDALLNKDTTCEADVIEDFSNTAINGNREHNLTDALTPDSHFEQAGFRALLR